MPNRGWLSWLGLVVVTLRDLSGLRFRPPRHYCRGDPRGTYLALLLFHLVGPTSDRAGHKRVLLAVHVEISYLRQDELPINYPATWIAIASRMRGSVFGCEYGGCQCCCFTRQMCITFLSRCYPAPHTQRFVSRLGVPQLPEYQKFSKSSTTLCDITHCHERPRRAQKAQWQYRKTMTPRKPRSSTHSHPGSSSPRKG